jgi:hypothetical protein
VMRTFKYSQSASLTLARQTIGVSMVK